MEVQPYIDRYYRRIQGSLVALAIASLSTTAVAEAGLVLSPDINQYEQMQEDGPNYPVEDTAAREATEGQKERAEHVESVGEGMMGGGVSVFALAAGGLFALRRNARNRAQSSIS